MKNVKDLGELELNALITDLVAEKNNAYSQRNINASVMARMAIALGLNAGKWFHEGEETGWGWIISVELPTGWVDWHIPDHEIEWFKDLPIIQRTWEDYTNEEKLHRLLSAKFDENKRMVN